MMDITGNLLRDWAGFLKAHSRLRHCGRRLAADLRVVQVDRLNDWLECRLLLGNV